MVNKNKGRHKETGIFKGKANFRSMNLFSKNLI